MQKSLVKEVCESDQPMLPSRTGETPIGVELRVGWGQVLAWLALIPASVPLVLVAALTWLLVGRPILFRQERAGLHGVPFTILKFRTMTDAVDSTGALLPDAQRTTFATRLLRRLRVDELPQLFSIARGDMAFIGPRPLLPSTIRDMGKLGVRRGNIRPGLTGWSQVNGNTLLNDRQKLALDMWYVDHRSPRLDLLIVWRTLMTVILGERVDTPQLATAEAYVRQLTAADEAETRVR